MPNEIPPIPLASFYNPESSSSPSVYSSSLPKEIGESADPNKLSDSTAPVGGAILRGLGELVRGTTRGFGGLFHVTAIAVNAVIYAVSVVVLAIAAIPGVAVGVGLSILGALIGAFVAGVRSGDIGDGASIGLHVGFFIGVGLFLLPADLPFLLSRFSVAVLVGGIGLGLAKLGGTNEEKLKEQFEILKNFTIILEKMPFQPLSYFNSRLA